MNSFGKNIISFARTNHQPTRRHISISSCHWRRKPKPERDQSKRNLQGEALEERLRRREEDIQRQQPYKLAVGTVVNQFKMEVDELERQKHDMQGDLMKREMAEREQALRNLAIIAESNEELRKQREIQKLIDEDEIKRTEEEELLQSLQKKEEIRQQNKKIVLRVIEESKSFILIENLDEKISAVLDSETNFNYAITPEGEKIYSTKPPGNLNEWKGPSPSSYLMGGYRPGSSEWNFIFKGQTLTDEKTSKETEKD